MKRSALLNFDWEMMTYWAIAGLSHAVLYYRESRDRALRAAQLETQLVEAQMAALQQQLQPHFLFNTLHAISALMHRDVDAADRTLMRLSDLLRMTLENLGQHEVHARRRSSISSSKYLEIEQTRFADRLVVRFDIEPETLDALLPTLLLQPLVENAIKHGVVEEIRAGPHRHHARGANTTSCWIEVRDDGARPVGDRADGAAERHRRVDDARAPAAPVRRGFPIRVPPARTGRGGRRRRAVADRAPRPIARPRATATCRCRQRTRHARRSANAIGTARPQPPALRRPYLGHTI